MNIDDLHFDSAGLVPVVVQDASSGLVLTLAYADREALQKTIQTRETHLHSRSRGSLWRKGETSGNTQRVSEVRYDCDADAVLYRVVPAGPACHTGAPSCFVGELLAQEQKPEQAGKLDAALANVRAVLAQRKREAPAGSYVGSLFAGGVDAIAQKIGEEATEVIIAAKNGARAAIVWESADLLFHTFVLLAQCDVSPDEVGVELLRRSGR